ncbi:MAG TPA: hypothetical protein VFW22_16230 [Pseudolabrys sp.]|nr:hypothetical protein [Pseudolabrys sp.]
MSKMLSTYDGTEGEARVFTMLPVGPVAGEFRESRAFIRSIMGPYGSGKTTTCFQAILLSALWQNPDPVDGVRRVRWCVIRDTYDQLETNVMADWKAWFPMHKGNYNGETHTHTLTINVPGWGRVEIQMLFRGLGSHKAEQVFKGMQLTGLWLNEADTLSMQVLIFGIARVGRYPAAKDGGCAWSGVICDFNAPDVDNWTYDLLVNEELDLPPEAEAKLREQYGKDLIRFFKQPGGLEPDAENIMNLPDGYYERLMASFDENQVRRFVRNEFGAISAGQPVYPRFRDALHCSPHRLLPLHGLPIDVGVDGGSTPAAVFCQQDPKTQQIRVLGELVIFQLDEKSQVKVLADLGPTAFGRECRQFAGEMWPHAKIGRVFGDPAGFDGGDEEDLAWMLKFGKSFGVKPKPSPVAGNRLTPRLEAVRGLLADEKQGTPRQGLLLSHETCKQLRRGFNNGYIIERIRYSDGSGRTKDNPKKNDFSHVHDALQYVVVGIQKRGPLVDDLDKRAIRRDMVRQQCRNVVRGGSYFSARPGPQPYRRTTNGAGVAGDRPHDTRRRGWRGGWEAHGAEADRHAAGTQSQLRARCGTRRGSVAQAPGRGGECVDRRRRWRADPVRRHAYAIGRMS